MALTLESQGRVRQKAREIIKNPGVFYTLKAFFLYLSIYKKNLDGLQLVVLDPTELIGTDGQVVADVPATVYAVWAKKQDDATASYLQVHDSATSDATPANIRLVIPNLVAEDEQVFFSPNGVAFAAGVTAGSHSSPATNVHSAAAADAPNGFVILGA